MAEECTETSIATSLGMPNWWPDLHANSISSWGSNSNTNNSPWQTQNPNSNSSGDEDVSISTSFTNASNHSGLTVDSSRCGLVEPAPANELIGETGSDNQLWNHVLLGNHEGLPTGMLPSSKGLSTGMFAPSPCSDYLKKMESSWEFMPPSSMNNFEKQFNDNNSLFESQRLNKLSNLVSDWSIAPPDHFNMARFSQSDMISHMKHKIMDRSSGDSFPYYNNPHDHMKVKDEHQSVETLPGTLFGQLLSGGNGVDYQLGLKNSILGDDDNKYYYGMQSAANTCPSTRSFADVISFNGLLNKPLLDSIQPIPPAYRSSSDLLDCKKPTIQSPSNMTVTTSQTVTRRGQGSNSEGKKKRAEEKPGTTLKKPKLESSTTKVPKVKLADKVTALQQIVSPFGKTDTASVLGEAIGYIKFLQEQVQLLSNPYMKTNISKDPWGGLDRNEEFDLKSRGLCLVPVSCTPQVYRENTGSDYWTPTYRGCLYR